MQLCLSCLQLLTIDLLVLLLRPKIVLIQAASLATPPNTSRAQDYQYTGVRWSQPASSSRIDYRLEVSS